MPEISPLIGPLQARAMFVLWAAGASTVKDVHEALNAQPGAPRLAYTTILTVMRSLANRKLLSQTAGARSHVFTPQLTREDYLQQVGTYVRETYFAGDASEYVKYGG